MYCSRNAADATAAAVNDLLAAWRFDALPVGDAGWATVEARKLLPSAVEPDRFPLSSSAPSQASEQAGNVVRITQVEAQGETVVVTFTYRWHEPSSGSEDDLCPPDRCHRWRFEARPDGEIILTEEGGAVPPGTTVEESP